MPTGAVLVPHVIVREPIVNHALMQTEIMKFVTTKRSYSTLAACMQSAWFLGVLWITQWESWLEVGLIFQIIPVLLIPLQEIVNNVLEEILSWFGGE
jgi:hypothetical protein